MVVITGATGLLGSVLVDHFSARNIPIVAMYRGKTPAEKKGVRWVEGDVTDINTLTEIFSGADCVVHGAALVSFARRNKKKMFATNTEGTANVVNACLLTSVKRLIHISSVAALGKIAKQKNIDESAPWPGSEKPTNYGQSKYLAELEVFRGEAEGLSTAMVNPSIILANGEAHRSSGQIFQYVQDERPFYTDGQLNYVDARDVAEMVFRLYENRSLRGRFIANAGTLPWNVFFSKIASRLGKKSPYIRISPGLTRVAAVIEHFRSLLMGKEPVITQETANLARQFTTYSNKKATIELAITFRDIENTLDWCCNAVSKRAIV